MTDALISRVTRFEEVVTQVDAWAGGGENDSVDFGGGPVRSPAKLIADNAQQFADALDGMIDHATEIASTAATTAVAARDAALIQAGVYATEAQGRSAVGDGEAFKVQGSGAIAAYEYRRIDAATSKLIATYPSGTITQSSGRAYGWSGDVKRVARWVAGMVAGKKVWAGLRDDGEVDLGGVSNITGKVRQLVTYFFPWSTRSGWAHAVTADNKVLYGLRAFDPITGRFDFVAGGLNLTQALAAQPDLQADVTTLKSEVFSEAGIVFAGDSLTANIAYLDPATSMPAQCAAILGCPYTNMGFSGANSSAIAQRIGVRPIPLTFPNNQIGTSGPITVGIDTATGLAYGALHGTVEGVHGTLEWTNDLRSCTFTPDEYPSSPVIVQPTTYFHADGVETIRHKTLVLWMGRNDQSTGTVGNFAAMKANIASALAFLRNKSRQLIVVGITNAANEPASSASFNSLRAQNEATQAAIIDAGYDPRIFVDVAPYLWAAGDPNNAQDVIDMQNKVPPYTLRRVNSDGSIDGLHFNADGTMVIAKAIAARIQQLGYKVV